MSQPNQIGFCRSRLQLINSTEHQLFSCNPVEHYIPTVRLSDQTRPILEIFIDLAESFKQRYTT